MPHDSSRPTIALRGIVWSCLSCALVACGSSSAPDTTMANAGSVGAGGAAGSVGASGAAGTSPTGGGGSAGAAGGNAGTAGVAGMNMGGNGEASGAAAAGGAAGMAGAGGAAGAGAAGASGAGGANDACPAPALFCDDFEKYAIDTTDLSPDWIAYAVSGTVTVDASKPRGGEKSLHLTTEAGMRHYASLIRYTSGVEVVPLRHFGRMMVWLTSIPTGAEHWNLNMSSGPAVGFPDEEVKFLEGGMYGKLMSNYAQRLRPMDGADYALRGGGPQQGDAPADSDCAVAAPNQTIAAGAWVCWEWEFDGPNGTAHLWLDNVAMTEVDAEGFGTQCQGPGFNGVPMSADYPWEGPELFDKIFVGWEQYQDMPAQELWIDDVVLSTERVGCPAP